MLLRQEVARDFPELIERWQHGPLAPEAERTPDVRGSSVIFSTRPWSDEDGRASDPHSVGGTPVIRYLRARRDVPGALLLLEDGRYAVTGPIAATGAASQLQRYARRRLSRAVTDSERSWWQEVIGALAR